MYFVSWYFPFVDGWKHIFLLHQKRQTVHCCHNKKGNSSYSCRWDFNKVSVTSLWNLDGSLSLSISLSLSLSLSLMQLLSDDSDFTCLQALSSFKRFLWAGLWRFIDRKHPSCNGSFKWIYGKLGLILQLLSLVW